MYDLLKSKEYEYDGFVVRDTDPIIYDEGYVEEEPEEVIEEDSDEEGYFSCGSENE